MRQINKNIVELCIMLIGKGVKTPNQLSEMFCSGDQSMVPVVHEIVNCLLDDPNSGIDFLVESVEDDPASVIAIDRNRLWFRFAYQIQFWIKDEWAMAESSINNRG